MATSPVASLRAATRLSIVAVVASCLAVMLLAVGTAPVAGQTTQPRIVYTLSGATFDDGGTLSGSFIFDPNVPCVGTNCQAYSSVNLTSSGGGAAFQGTITYTDANLVPGSGQPLVLILEPEQTFFLSLEFNAVLGATGTVPLAGGTQWDGVGQTRVLTGSLVGVEEAPPPTDPPVTDPPVTDPPVTDPPVTDPPVTDPPVTDPPVTDPPSDSTTTTAAPVVTDPTDSTSPGATSPPTSSPSGGVGSQNPASTPLPVTGSATWITFFAALAVLAGGVALVRLARPARGES